VIGDLCADFYIVEVTDANGQVRVDTVSVEEVEDPGYMVEVQSDSLWIPSGESYAWFFNGTTAIGGDSASHVAEFTGNYHAVVTDAFGCQWNSDTVLVVLNVGLEEQLKATLRAWPNPAAGALHVDFPGIHGTPAELINSAGQRVRSFTLRQGVNTVDISGLESGLYALRSAGGLVVRVVVE
jgi:hypothetical protein